MKKTACFVLLLFVSSIPSAAFGEYYMGFEYNYYNIDVKKIDGYPPLIDLHLPTYGVFTGIQDLDFYCDHYNGASLFFGYRFHLPISIEAGFLKSESNRGNLDGPHGVFLSAESDLSFESYRLDILTHFSRPYLGNLKLIGSVGIVMQKMNAWSNYLHRVDLEPVIIFPGEEYEPPPPRLVVGEIEINEKRLQLGAGASYEFNKNLSLRGIFRFIPAGFSYSDDKPYLLNVGLIYSF